MSAFERLPRWSLLLVALVLVACLGVALLARDGGEQAVRADVVLRAASDRAALVEAVERLPARGGTIVLGSARLEVTDPSRPLRELAGAFLELGRIDAPGGTVRLAQGRGDQPIVGSVERREDALPLAQAILERLTPRGSWPAGISGLRVEAGEAPGALVAIGRLGSGREAATTALSAAAALADAVPIVSVAPSGTELRVQADGVADVRRVWRAAARAAQGRKDVRVYVDVLEQGDRRPVLSGPADDSPDRALVLLRGLDADAYATTDLSFARVRVDRPEAAGAAVRAARRNRVERVEVAWRSADDDAGWFDAAGVDRGDTFLEDAPAVVEGLLAGVERARAAGVPALHWSRRAQDGVPALKLARPAWLDADVRLSDDAARLRRLARAIRRIGWPGAARFSVALGPGTCEGRPEALAVAEVTSTSSGRARRVEPAAACVDEAGLSALREAWDATAR